jgi:hypothetical protein
VLGHRVHVPAHHHDDHHPVLDPARYVTVNPEVR